MMMIEVGFWRRLYRIIRANVNHYRHRPNGKVSTYLLQVVRTGRISRKPIPVKVKVRPWTRPETVYIQPPRHHLDSLQEARRLEIKAKSKPKPVKLDTLANDILTYQRAATRASMSRNDPHNYYHRER